MHAGRNRVAFSGASRTAEAQCLRAQLTLPLLFLLEFLLTLSGQIAPSQRRSINKYDHMLLVHDDRGQCQKIRAQWFRGTFTNQTKVP
jgi:hypothetical protein